MRPRGFSFSHPDRSIGQASIILSICGVTLTSVSFNINHFSYLMALTYLESTEEADSQEALEFDDDDYPQLPENVMELRLHRRKAFLRLFMAAARRPFYLKSFRKHVLTIEIQDSTSFKVVSPGPTSRNIRPIISPKSHDLIPTTSFKNRRT